MRIDLTNFEWCVIALQSRPIMAFVEPRRIMEHRVRSGFDAAMIAVNCLMAADLCIFEAVRRLLGHEGLDVLAQCALIAFEREDVVSLLIHDLHGDVALAAHRVDGNAKQRFSDRPTDRGFAQNSRP
jgi:hypothetical protein